MTDSLTLILLKCQRKELSMAICQLFCWQSSDKRSIKLIQSLNTRRNQETTKQVVVTIIESIL